MDAVLQRFLASPCLRTITFAAEFPWRARNDADADFYAEEVGAVDRTLASFHTLKTVNLVNKDGGSFTSVERIALIDIMPRLRGSGILKIKI